MTVKEYMEMSNLTYRQLGIIWGVGYSTIHHWVNKTAKPCKKNKKMVIAKTKGLVTFED